MIQEKLGKAREVLRVGVLFKFCTSALSVRARSGYRRRTALVSGSTNPCHKARHHVTTLTFSTQNCAGNVTGLLTLFKRFFNDLAKRRVDRLLRDTCNQIVIAEENKCLRESHHRLQQPLVRRRLLAQLQRPMPSPSHHELPVPPTKDKNRQQDTEDNMGCCAHAEFAHMSTLPRAFMCNEVGLRQILHSNMLSAFWAEPNSVQAPCESSFFLKQEVEVLSFQYNSTCVKCDNIFGTKRTADLG